MENKHYIRVDENGYIILVFSDAFIQPSFTDILYKENAERHFILELFDEEGNFLYKYDAETNTIIEAF
jgi:hypothetical protein